MSNQPYIPFYVGDWLSDPNVSMLSPLARGIWIDLLCAMHKNNRSGKISGTIVQLSRIARCNIEEFKTSLNELESTKTADVTNGNEKVTVINRRMKKESNNRISTRERVKRHRSEFKKNVVCNKNVQKSNAFYDNEDEDEDKKKELSAKVKLIIDNFNEAFESKYRATTKKTITLIKARLDEGFTVEDFKLVHRKMNKCWGDDEKMIRYLRPSTLYNGDKFEGYLNQKMMDDKW